VFFDAHCHLQDDRYGDGLEVALRRAAEAGVAHMACCGTREDDWGKVLELARAHREILPMAGLHPWYVDTATPGWTARLEAAFDAGAGAGECGLDFTEGRPTRDLQEAALRTQLDLAARRGLPVSLHCVKAAERLLEILAETGLPHGGLVHAFSGPPETALRFQALGLHLSFGRALTFPGAKRARASFDALRDDRILFETDSPDLTPEGAAGLNEPANIRLVAAAAARPVPAFDNARRLFRRWIP
jgi:TatD DNase family protein